VRLDDKSRRRPVRQREDETNAPLSTQEEPMP
jgi:hypothetical protein